LTRRKRGSGITQPRRPLARVSPTLCGDSGTPAWEAFLELTRGTPGGNNNPAGVNQYTAEEEVKVDNVNLDHTLSS
jgi:hypothetical protein